MIQPKYSLFNYAAWYKNIYNQLKDGDIFIEIGTWTGSSTLYFADLIKNGNKNIIFYTIDTFEGSLEHKKRYGDFLEDDGLYKYFKAVKKSLRKFIKVLRMDSQKSETAAIFEDGSVAAIFIDGDHSHDGVLRDLKNWYPKIKEGGIISGHDYIWCGKGVKPIVDEFSEGKAKEFIGDVWYYENTRTDS